MISIEIDSVDQSDIISFSSVVKNDVINQKVDTLNFVIDYYASQTFRPVANSEVSLLDGIVKEFGGRIHSVFATNMGKGKIRYSIKCKDFSYDFDRALINEEFNSETVDDIIAAIIVIVSAKTGFTFTDTNVNCPIVIEKVSFSRVNGTSALERLADITGYSWYIDQDKDIHFFEKNTELAPFNLTDDSENYIITSLELSNDFSQIRNSVSIKGGEIEGVDRDEFFPGDGERLQFKLSNKFARVPAVEVDGSPVTVGVDFIDNEASFDCFWDFNQQYIRFKAGTVPGVPGGPDPNNIVVTGTPLFNLVAEVSDPASISEHGLFEFARDEKTLLSRDEIVAYAQTELAAYAQGVIEGRFKTYTSGLRSGQVINIQSDLFDVDEDFIIQKVTFREISANQGEWTVSLATLRTVGIIDLLLRLLRQGDALVGDTGETVIEKTEFLKETISFGDEIAINTDDIPLEEEMSLSDELNLQAIDFPVEFVAGPYEHDPTNPTDFKRVFILDGSPLG